MGRTGWIAAVLAAVFVWSVPVLARACACCGSEARASVVGWSRDGKRFVVHHELEATCWVNEQYEIWTLGGSAPEYCLGAYLEDSSEPVDCSEAVGTDPNSPVPAPNRGLSLPEGFDAVAPTLSAEQVLAWGAERLASEGPDYVFELEVLTPRGFRSAKVRDYAPSVEAATLPATLAIWPAPRGRTAVMFVQEYEEADEINMRIVWVTLPRGYDEDALSEEPTWVSPRRPPRLPASHDRDQERIRAARLLAMARVYERTGEYEEALDLVDIAASRAPAQPSTWAALAHLLALSDRVEQALVVLARLDALGSDACRKAVRGVLDTPAFAPLRERRDVQRLMGAP